jgi:hypothetical protein
MQTSLSMIKYILKSKLSKLVPIKALHSELKTDHSIGYSSRNEFFAISEIWF